MQRKIINGLALWQFENLGGQTGIKHFVTERKTNPATDEFTLSLSSHPNHDFVRENRRALASALGLEPHRLFFPSQVHQTRILRVTENTPREELMDTDALITNQRGIGIAVMSADCVPILIYDPANDAVAAVHSGWKGTVARILEKTLHKMQSEFGSRGSDLITAIGPSVCQDSYEVGEEVIAQVENAFGHHAGLMIAQPQKKAKLDLWKANEIQLREFGVVNIEVGNLCTVKNNEHFFSARKGDKGRFAAGIVLL